MKFRLAASLLLIFLLIAGSSMAAEPQYRAIQVHTWVSGMLSPEEVDTTIKWAKDANMNMVILQARRVGDAYYKSAYEPRATNIKGGDNFDPMAYGIKKCRENGLQVYAWFNVYRIWSGNKPNDPNHVVNKHPEWISKNTNGESGTNEGVYLDPGVPEAREHNVKVIADFLSKYDVDGIMLDYVRYPGRQWGYSDIAVAKFNKAYGRTGKPAPDDPTWGRWRREQVTQQVRMIYKEINRIKPNVALSAATIPWGPCPTDWSRTDAYGHVFQDWRAWMQEGILDVNMPMNYKDPANQRNQQWYIDWLEGMKRWAYGRHAVSTVMVFNANAEGAAGQMKLAHEHGLPGAGGFAFSHASCSAELAKKLRATVYTEPAPVPKMPWKAKKPTPQAE